MRTRKFCRTVSQWFMVVILALGLVACSTGPSPAAETKAPPPAPLKKLRVAHSMMNFNPSVVWVAQDQGIFTKHGLDVEFVFIESGTTLTQALVAGEAPLAVAASAVIPAIAKGADIKIIGGFVSTFPYDFVVTPDIKTAADLKGKKLGVSKLGSASHTALRKALKNVGVDEESVVFMQTGSETARLASMKAGAVQGTVVDPTLSAELKKAGFRSMLSLYEANIPYFHTGIVASGAFLKNERATAEAFLKGIVEATAFYLDPKNEQAVIDSISRHLRMDEAGNKNEIIKMGYQMHRDKYYQLLPYPSVPGVEAAVVELKLEQELKVSSVIDDSILRGLEQQGFHKQFQAAR